ncbi:hypothetical protein [Streptomyces sp. NRRL S-118]|uniref:hypothetical protein n=1 Tax=Streptomyces sp. NRRL S-118 TaxID=1463881 RepID=UPI00131C755E|nr:hypothetical protein [Streptomyces sp. NRRL S-118]
MDYYQTLKVDGADLRAIVLDALDGDLFAVSGPMGELAATAGGSLELFDMEAQDVPSLTGVLAFEAPPALLQGADWDGSLMTLHGAAWAVREAGEGGCVWITPIAQPSDSTEPLLGGPRLLPFSMADQAPAMTREKNLFDFLVTTLRAAWLLMVQPLADCSEVPPSRAIRKRLRRINNEPASVRLIDLRRPKIGNAHGSGNRDYHYQWIVRGHWRQQWYPVRQVHRPVWIAPHVKGPEGAPLLGGEKVNVWRR